MSGADFSHSLLRQPENKEGKVSSVTLKTPVLISSFEREAGDCFSPQFR